MRTNIHFFERFVRIGGGLFILYNVFWGIESPWAWLGLIPLVTGLSGWCPPYALLGISTCSTGKCSDSSEGCCSTSR